MTQDHFAAVARRLSGAGPDVSMNPELNPDQGHFFFEGAQRQHALETIRHLINFGDMLLFIGGETEIGKSAILQHAVQSVKDEVHVIFLQPDASEGTDGHDLITHLAHQSAIFESPSDTASDLLKRCMKSYADLRAQSGKRTAILVDDLERYKNPEIRLLMKAAETQEDDGAWVLVMSGAPDTAANLQSMLANPADKLHVVQLSPLSKQETKAYVLAGLESAGIDEPHVISETALQWLYLRSKGLPGRIEALLASALFNVNENDVSAPDGSGRKNALPTRVLVLIVVALLVSFAFVAQQHNLMAGLFDKESANVPIPDESAKKQRLAMLDKALEQSKKFDQSAVETKGETFASSESEPMHTQKGSQRAVDQDEKVEQEKAPSNELEKNVGLDESEIIAIRKPDPEIIVSEPAIEKPSKQRRASEQAENKVVLPSEEISFSKSDSSSPVGGGRSESDVKRITVSKSKVSHPAYRDSRWLSTKPKDAYTMQVLGSYNEKTAKSFIDRARVDKLFYIESTHKGKPWYVVLYGEYASKKMAQDALKSLPEPVAKVDGIWLRSMSRLNAR